MDRLSAFRILTIDGGGVRGFLAAAILANVEVYLNTHTNSEAALGRRFDLICGTSAGGLIALGLACGHKAADLRRLFFDLVPKVFGQANRSNPIYRVNGPKYGAGALQDELSTFFREKTLRDLLTDCCVVSVSLQDATPRLYKTDYLKRNAGRLDEKLVDIAMATTAAPTYFPAHSLKYSADLIDGGITANNPSMIALVDALQFEKASQRGVTTPLLGNSTSHGVMMLSIGTGDPGPMPYDHEKLRTGGILQWARPIHEVILTSQSRLIHHQAAFLLKERYHRINPVLSAPMKLDDAERIHELINKADLTEATERFLKQYF